MSGLNSAQPVRLRLSRQRGFVLQDQSPDGRPVVNVARPSRLGNPYVVGVHGDAATCVALYRSLLNTGPVMVPPPDVEKAKARENALRIHAEAKGGRVPVLEIPPPTMTAGAWTAKQKLHRLTALESLTYLRGKHLACWCGPEAPCHADVLLKLARDHKTAADMLARFKAETARCACRVGSPNPDGDCDAV
ncbi:MAG: DUF4326 domain-containing protein [Pseudomonadota bacterium]